MDIIIVENYDQISAKAAELVAAEITAQSRPVLGLATGSTPLGMYARLVEMFKEGLLDFHHIVCFNLDEYAGLPPEHPQSYHSFMHKHFFDHLNVCHENIHIPNCANRNVESFCRNYDQSIIAAGGINLQVLGIGINGHIGFNEPDDCLAVYTHLVDLAEETRAANSRFFDSPAEVPRQAVTMGMGSIMQAARILLLASGEGKAGAVQQMVNGKITTRVPASLLQLHRHAVAIIDRAAAALIEKS